MYLAQKIIKGETRYFLRESYPQEDLADEVHIFDKRRVHFLRFGQTDQGNISRLPQKMFGMLHDKSRDEIEQTLMDMERQLAVREYKTYANQPRI